MGRLIYNDDTKSSYEIPDEILTPLRVVVANKLRRSESFMLSVALEGTGGWRSIWIAPSVRLVWHVFGGTPARVDRDVVHTMMEEANGPNGLDLRPFVTARRQPSSAAAGPDEDRLVLT